MPKVGFLPFLGLNYGSTLQSCALYEAIKMLDYDCEVIDCGWKEEYIKECPEPAQALKEDNITLYNKQRIKKDFHTFICNLFEFNKKIGSMPANAEINDHQKKELASYGAFVCGSDQIWKPHDFWFCAKRYLQFAPEEKRIAYAPSLHWKKIPDYLNARKPQWLEWIASVKYISTRETGSSELISKNICRSVATVIDPSLLLQPKDWERILPEGKYSPEITRILASGKPYLLAYLLDNLSGKHKQYALDLAKKLDLEIIWLLGRDIDKIITQNVAETDPAGFVNLVRNASFVLTDGFHGTCFSLNFSRPFLVLKNAQFANDARIDDLLRRMGAADRLADASQSVDNLNPQMDYAAIHANLEKERQKSLAWLKDALEGAINSQGALYERASNEMLAQKLRREENLGQYLEISAGAKNFLSVLILNPAPDASQNMAKICADIQKYIPALNLEILREAMQANKTWLAIIYDGKPLDEKILENEAALQKEIIECIVKNTEFDGRIAAGLETALNDTSINLASPGLNILDYDVANNQVAAQKNLQLAAPYALLAPYGNINIKNETNFEAYLQELGTMDDNIIILAVRDTITPSSSSTNIRPKAYAVLQKLGFGQLGHGPGKEFQAGYIAIKYKNFMIYEQLAPRGNSLATEMNFLGLNIKAISSPYKSFNIASIKIDDQEFAVNKRGLNIVTFDPFNKKLVDSVAFDAWKPEIPAQRGILENNFYNYLAEIKKLDDCLIIFSARDTIGPHPDVSNITQAGYDMLADMGLKQLGHSPDREFWAGYIAIINKGNLIFESLASRNQKAFFKNNVDGLNIAVVSAPYRAGNLASIKINGKEYAVNKRGLNIVVFDLLNKSLKDAVAFDTWKKNIPASRNMNDLVFFSNIKLDKYLQSMAGLDDQLIIFAAKDTLSPTSSPVDSVIKGKIAASLNKLGLNAFEQGGNKEFWAGYIAVIHKNKVVFEQLGEYGKTITYANNLDGVDCTVVSSPYNAENIASIKINSMDYAVNQRGLNIVVYDLKNKHLVDTTAFDTWRENAPVQRNFKVEVKNKGGKKDFELLTPAMEIKKKVESLYKDPLFDKVKIIASLLRDYNIKHIVLSSGTRHAPLVRMFENNKDIFTLYSVVDERSAGYFAMGLATQLREPVVCVCTSGTAASNYLPPVTEAFYTGVPLIIITTDRMAFLLNHGDDQTIPQQNIYNGVVKKSVTIPEGNAWFDSYQTRRDVIDCILECTHHFNGPVHINMAIDNAWIGANIPPEYWQLKDIQPNPVQPHITRVEVDNNHKDLNDCLAILQKSNRILIVYGQNPPPNAEQLENIEKFSKKFNCVILTDLISNLHSSHTMPSFNMLEKIPQREFDDILAPEILISVGGKRLMNDPLTDKIRNSKINIQYWSVNPDGKLKDFYFKLSKVIESSQDYFFNWFVNHGENSCNNNEYYNIWKKTSEYYHAPIGNNFDSHYIQSKFIPAIPAKSLLHLGVGLSFYFTRRYVIDNSVEVYCNMGVNGIDGCTSTFMGACSVNKERLCFLLVGDLSFFYDMNSIWNKTLNKNIRILLINNNGSDLLRYINLGNITCVHNTSPRAWVESVGFEYLAARNKEEFDSRLQYFVSDAPERPVFFEAIYNF